MVSYQVAHCPDNAPVEFSGDSARRGMAGEKEPDISDFVEKNCVEYDVFSQSLVDLANLTKIGERIAMAKARIRLSQPTKSALRRASLATLADDDHLFIYSLIPSAC